MTDDMIYNMKYDFLDVCKYVIKHGKTTLQVPIFYTWKKEIFTGIGKVNIYTANKDYPFLIEAENFKCLPTERLKCPNSLSKYMRFHDHKTQSVYEIEYKNEKFHVTKKTGE